MAATTSTYYLSAGRDGTWALDRYHEASDALQDFDSRLKAALVQTTISEADIDHLKNLQTVVYKACTAAITAINVVPLPTHQAREERANTIKKLQIGMLRTPQALDDVYVRSQRIRHASFKKLQSSLHSAGGIHLGHASAIHILRFLDVPRCCCKPCKYAG